MCHCYTHGGGREVLAEIDFIICSKASTFIGKKLAHDMHGTNRK